MKRREPKLCMWLLSAIGIQISGSRLETSFPLRWALGSLNFMLSWGTIMLTVWLVTSGFEGLARQALGVLVGRVVYGAINASLSPVSSSPGLP